MYLEKHVKIQQKRVETLHHLVSEHIQLSNISQHPRVLASTPYVQKQERFRACITAKWCNNDGPQNLQNITATSLKVQAFIYMIRPKKYQLRKIKCELMAVIL